MKMTEDEVALGAAMMLLRRHGDLAPVRAAERIGELALAGDQEGVLFWKRVAQRMDQILRPGAVQ
jgi:hypothetical protein